VATLEHLLKKICRKTERGMTMSRRNTDAITIHSILDWIEITWNRRSRWKKCLSVQVTPNGTCNGCLKKTGHSLGQYIRSRKLTEIAQN
jgi:AraC family mar-sox-rob regulon transcriptional activator